MSLTPQQQLPFNIYIVPSSTTLRRWRDILWTFQLSGPLNLTYTPGGPCTAGKNDGTDEVLKYVGSADKLVSAAGVRGSGKKRRDEWACAKGAQRTTKIPSTYSPRLASIGRGFSRESRACKQDAADKSVCATSGNEV